MTSPTCHAIIYTAASLFLLSLTGCVYTNGEAVPNAAAPTAQEMAAQPPKNASMIVISEGDVSNQAYTHIGKVSAYGRMITLESSQPTREDVNEALREEASKIGADAVIFVTYKSERTGLMSRGMMTGEGQAVIFTDTGKIK